MYSINQHSQAVYFKMQKQFSKMWIDKQKVQNIFITHIKSFQTEIQALIELLEFKLAHCFQMQEKDKKMVQLLKHQNFQILSQKQLQIKILEQKIREMEKKTAKLEADMTQEHLITIQKINSVTEDFRRVQMQNYELTLKINQMVYDLNIKQIQNDYLQNSIIGLQIQHQTTQRHHLQEIHFLLNTINHQISQISILENITASLRIEVATKQKIINQISLLNKDKDQQIIKMKAEYDARATRTQTHKKQHIKIILFIVIVWILQIIIFWNL